MNLLKQFSKLELIKDSYFFCEIPHDRLFIIFKSKYTLLSYIMTSQLTIKYCYMLSPSSDRNKLKGCSMFSELVIKCKNINTNYIFFLIQ